MMIKYGTYTEFKNTITGETKIIPSVDEKEIKKELEKTGEAHAWEVVKDDSTSRDN